MVLCCFQVPIAIREQDMDEHYFELDGWARWDMPTDDYYDAYVNEEGYTGYDGSEVWQFIHDRICFHGYAYDDNHWKADFNKAVSGLHSMVSAQVVRGIKERVESGGRFTDREIWTDPKKEFERRLGRNGETPLAMENLYFCFMLLLRAVAEAKSRLVQDCSGGMSTSRLEWAVVVSTVAKRIGPSGESKTARPCHSRSRLVRRAMGSKDEMSRLGPHYQLCPMQQVSIARENWSVGIGNGDATVGRTAW
jgi:Endoplasmic Reticulum Oxidoreductin 1 (ERO1)